MGPSMIGYFGSRCIYFGLTAPRDRSALASTCIKVVSKAYI